MRNVYWQDNFRLTAGLPIHLIASAIRHVNETFFPIERAVTNWPDVLLVYLGLRKSATAHFRDFDFVTGRKQLGTLMSLTELVNLPDSVKHGIGLQIAGNMATLNVKGKKLRLDLEVANSVAIELYTKEHSMIDVKGRDVIDIGAYVNDTAIYYALSEGAKHVYAFEPFPYLYKTAVRNVAANGLDRKITTYNVAVAGAAGSTKLDASFTSFGKVESVGKGSKKENVGVVSLDSVVKKLKIKRGALKVDCEGCEYGIFGNSSSKTLRSFDLIHVEYHYGYRDIVERLKKEGFAVNYTRPVYNFKGLGSRSMLNGHIVATKK